MEVTVDANKGCIYKGISQPLVESSRPTQKALADPVSHTLLQSIFPDIAPLNLLHPSDPNFNAEYCRTLHDITRFAHQRAMEEMFASVYGMGKKWKVCYRLKSDIPLLVDVIFLDRNPPSSERRATVTEAELRSPMMTAFWAGMREEGWPQKPRQAPVPIPARDPHFLPDSSAEYSTTCHTILSRDYMFLSLRMGFHYTTLEAFCSEESAKNYLRFQYKGGGAVLERRTARITLLEGILTEIGFENRSEGDFLDAVMPYRSCPENLTFLKALGRLTILTKQLDMALCNEAIVLWYHDYIKRRLEASLASDSGGGQPEDSPGAAPK